MPLVLGPPDSGASLRTNEHPPPTCQVCSAPQSSATRISTKSFPPRYLLRLHPLDDHVSRPPCIFIRCALVCLQSDLHYIVYLSLPCVQYECPIYSCHVFHNSYRVAAGHHHVRCAVRRAAGRVPCQDKREGENVNQTRKALTDSSQQPPIYVAYLSQIPECYPMMSFRNCQWLRAWSVTVSHKQAKH
jgi:hypothetical protein